MNPRTPSPWFQGDRYRLTRRTVLRGAGMGLTGAGAALLLGCGGDEGSDDELETTTITIAKHYTICLAPQFVAKEFLLEEGFTKVEYKLAPQLHEDPNRLLSTGEVSMTMNNVVPLITGVDSGQPLVGLAGTHVGCYEIFAREGINSIAELKGKKVLVHSTDTTDGEYQFIKAILRFIGISPDIVMDWKALNETYRLLQDGKVDAVVTTPPLSQTFRTAKVGHSIFNSMEDRPYSELFCCMVMVGRDFLERNPVATKRALRAIMKATDRCAREPEWVARYLVDHNFTSNYDYALEAMRHMRYEHWRDWDPGDTVRRASLLLHELGVIKSTPEEIIKKATDWRFLSELKQELAYFPPQGGGRSAFALDCAIEGPQEG